MLSPFELIPSQFHLASLFIIGIAGFFIVIRFSSVKEVKEGKSVTIRAEPSDIASIASETHTETPEAESPRKTTPVSSPSRNALSPKYGSVVTPGGRRSARIASKSTQKKPRD